MKKKLATITLVGSLLALTACSNTEEIVATSKAGDITKEELYQELKKASGEETLTKMIDNLVLADKYKVTNKEIDAEIEKLKEQFDDEEAYKQALESNKMTEKELRTQAKEFILYSKATSDGVDITDEKLKEYYETNKAKYSVVKAQHILVADEATAKTLKTRLDAGEDFATLAKEFSTDGSAAQGGDLGEFTKGQMVEEFENVAFSIEVNTVSDPVATQFGYHLIKVNERTDKTFEEAKEQVKSDYIQENGNDMTEVIEKLKEKTKVEIKDKELKPVDNPTK